MVDEWGDGEFACGFVDDRRKEPPRGGGVIKDGHMSGSDELGWDPSDPVSFSSKGFRQQ